MGVERQLPQNLEAERGVLGSLMIDPDAILSIADFLSPDDFYRDGHRIIYGVILQLFNQRTPADFITVCDVLEQQNKLEEAGGMSYIASLVNYVPTSGNVMYYGRIISRTALLRRLISAGGQIVARAFEDGEEDATNTLDYAEHVIFEISQRYGNSLATSSHIRDLLVAYTEQLDAITNNQRSGIGVRSGFVDLDRLLGGFQRSDLIIMAARPGMGKTSMALSLALNAAKEFNHKVGIFSLEMSKEQLIQRLLSVDSGVDQQRLRVGWIEDDEWDSIVASMGRLSEIDIWIDDTSSISTGQMRSKARRWCQEHGVELLIVDYLQLMQATSIEGRKMENRVQEVSMISRALKSLARELNIPVIALAQLSRAVESRQSKVPQLSDLRESGSIEADSDVVLFIYRDDVYNPDSERPNTANIIVAKHRNGPVGEVCLAFDKQFTRFRNLFAAPVVKDEDASLTVHKQDYQATAMESERYNTSWDTFENSLDEGDD